MYLRNLTESLRRRWYLVLAGLIGVVALGGVTYLQVPPTYEADADVVLLPPQTTVAIGGNPYLYLGGLGPALDVLTRSLDDDSTREAILGSSTVLDYTVAPDSSTAGPILLIEATGPDPEQTLAVLADVLAATPERLEQLQDELSVVDEAQITSMTLTVDPEATVVGRTRLRAVIAVVAVSAGGSVLLIGLLDGILLRRSRRTRPDGRVDPRDERAASSTLADSGEERRGEVPIARLASRSERT